MRNVILVNPAGNITAIVRGSVEAEHRILVSKEIMADLPQVEQVGFEVAPLLGGDCRLEMMGGEFCGNASRAFGYLIWKERYESSILANVNQEAILKSYTADDYDSLQVEISGAPKPIEVHIHPSTGEAYTDMPLPYKMEKIEIPGLITGLPLIYMDGILHVILEDVKRDETLMLSILEYLKHNREEDAYGILFLNNEEMVPAVYVCDMDSLVWESSCGSGTTACAWYGMQKQIDQTEDGKYRFTFAEPGGILNTEIEIRNHEIAHIFMGGQVSISES